MITTTLRTSALALLLATACDAADPDDTAVEASSTADDGSTSDSTGDSTDDGPTAQALFDCDTGAFAISKPLVGPGFDPARGGVLGALQPTYVVHTTQLFLDPERIAEFQAIADPVSVQLDQTEGLLAYSYAGDQGCGEASTLAIWESEAAMYRFVSSGAHAQAMARADEVGLAGRVAHWTVTGAEANAIDWEVARARIREAEASPVFR